MVEITISISKDTSIRREGVDAVDSRFVVHNRTDAHEYFERLLLLAEVPRGEVE